jgi:hypothetical protein
MGSGQRDEVPVAAALGAMVAYDGIVRIEPREIPQVILPRVSKRVYRANSILDADKDGTACEVSR